MAMAGSIEEYVYRIYTHFVLLTATRRSALSDTQPSTNVASLAENDEEEVFTYPTDEEEDFVYPGTSVDATAHKDPLPVSAGTPERPMESDLPLDSAVESDTVAETAPSFLSSPPQAQASSHPSPAQLEALSAAASQGDLVLLKKLFATALQGGALEAFALANDASSRTGFTALHAAASRGYLDIVKWREY